MADILLVTCVKAKRSAPSAAKDLYTSPLFRKQRAYAESQSAPWFILSAEHGLVAPDDWLAPYERYLPETPRSYRDAWGAWVVERLDVLAGPLAGKTVEIHAGSTYIESISGRLEDKGASLDLPLTGLGVGERLNWYGTSARSESPDIASRLSDRESARTPVEFLGCQDAELKGPGLYSWWIDDEGAADLSAGLALSIRAGLIYIGLAGATRWPSGRRSSNTLSSRIAGMHLGGRHEFSTFRRTLGSVLAHAAGATEIDETKLTSWMFDHLVIVTAPYPDADGLGHLESEILDRLDPPLNLRGRPMTPIRSRLSELRRPYR